MLVAVPPRDRLPEVLRSLARIRQDPSSPASLAELRREAVERHLSEPAIVDPG
jgi:hypothetical protein